MGYFSWIFSDTEKNLKIGSHGYLLLPDGGYLYVPHYEGFGVFDGKDVYDLVLEWNRPYLNKDMLIPPDLERLKGYPEPYAKEWYERALKEYENNVKYLEAYKNGMTDEEMLNLTNEKDWKRYLGIEIACYNAQNAALPCPIKIVQLKKNVGKYKELPPSKSDPEQGF